MVIKPMHIAIITAWGEACTGRFTKAVDGLLHYEAIDNKTGMQRLIEAIIECTLLDNSR